MVTATIPDSGPGLGVDDLRKVDVTDNVFETTLTTEQCKRILGATRRHAVNFRQLADSAKTNMLTEAMKKDQWVWTDSDPLRLHLHVQSGEIVCSDGQHRLYAAVQARKSLHTLVLWGDGWKAGVHVDRNRNRNVAQFLTHEYDLGKSATVYVAAARLHLARLLAAENGLAINYARNMVPDEALIEFIVKNQETLSWGIGKAGSFSQRGFSFTGAHVFLYELQVIRQDVADAFYHDFGDPELEPTDPLAQLRRATNRRFDDTGIRLGAMATVNNLIKAHNVRSGGESLAKWHNANSTDVVFPAGFKNNGKKPPRS